MKIAIASLMFLASTLACADDYNLMETTNEARMRHENERYQEYKRNDNRAPLGGYGDDRFGSTAPTGTRSPGMSDAYNNQYERNNNQWNPQRR